MTKDEATAHINRVANALRTATVPLSESAVTVESWQIIAKAFMGVAIDEPPVPKPKKKG